MRILHTSDWHLGRTLYGKRRHREFAQFLDWLQSTLQEQSIDVLLIAGDIFDTNTPGNQAQHLYYQFLANVASSGCRHVVVIGGNHDSPSFLDAPQHLLRALQVHVIGAACEDPADEVIPLYQDGALELIVCAVPYLRDRDLRSAEAGESIEDKEQKLLEGISAHYAATADHALKLRGDRAIPIVGMGHLFAAGGQVEEGDGVRDLYVGSLGKVPAQVFPAAYDYLALGHLHVPQLVNGQPHLRYSGSPIAMGFGEAKQQKEVVLVTFNGTDADIKALPVPSFQTLRRISGDLDAVTAALHALVSEDESVWVEVDFQGTARVHELRERLQLEVEDSKVEILRVRNRSARQAALQAAEPGERLQDLNMHDVFARRLQNAGVEEAEQEQMRALYQEIIKTVQEADPRENS
ncbi:exonuclease SbcCD subunit D C-terminal domain-containing protein [Aliidiomarina sp. Khilg15.8]